MSVLTSLVREGQDRVIGNEQGSLNSLHFPEMTERSRMIENATKGTCDWILQHPFFTRWASSCRGLLWVNGIPGCGKSTLMRHTLDNISQSKSVPTLSFFCHGRGSPLQISALGLYRSLLYQLLLYFPQACHPLVQTFERGKDPKGTYKWTLHELKVLLETCLDSVLLDNPLRIFIDALDELDEDAGPGIVRHLRQVVTKQRSCAFAICYSSRRYGMPNIPDCAEIRVAQHNNEDITRHVQSELANSFSDHEFARLLERDIPQRSNGVFQWVRLVIPRILALREEGMTIRQVRQELEKIPNDLKGLYGDIIQNLKRRGDSRSLKLL